MRKANIIVSSLLLLLSAFFIYEAKKLPVSVPGAGIGPGVVPIWLAIGMIILAGLLLITNVLNRDKYGKGNVEFTLSEIIGVGIILAVLVVYMVAMDYLGFGIATIFMITFISKRIGNYAIWKCGLIGIIVAVVCVQVFRVFLHLPLPTGITGF